MIRRRRRSRPRFRASLLALLFGGPLAAQGARTPVPSAADVAISQGRVDDAEELLFTASSKSSREPSARGALGMFLASRGKLRVGTVLLEEARQFGGDAAVIDSRLARIYPWLGDWAAVAALRRGALAGPELDRAKWLASNPSTRAGADSVKIPLDPNELAGLGRIALVIGGATIQADIDPNVEGLVLPSRPVVTAVSQQFGMRDTSSIAVVFGVAIGTLRLTNVPARLSPNARPLIGLDVLAALTPTFDAPAHSLTLRQQAGKASGESLPILLGFPGVRLVARAGQPPVPLESAAGRAALRGARWTLDVKRGAIGVQR